MLRGDDGDIVIGARTSIQDNTVIRRIAGFNPITGRLRCPYCTMIMALGLLAYPVRSRGRKGPVRPADQKPTWRELLAMRALVGGFYLPEAKLPGDHLNLYVEDECRCGHSSIPCPIHASVMD